jgi:hypothetical protein
MPIAVHYPHDPRTAAPRHLDATTIRRLALQVRRQIGVPAEGLAIAVRLARYGLVEAGV